MPPIPYHGEGQHEGRESPILLIREQWSTQDLYGDTQTIDISAGGSAAE
jgi:hypothetical protein